MSKDSYYGDDSISITQETFKDNTKKMDKICYLCDRKKHNLVTYTKYYGKFVCRDCYDIVLKLDVLRNEKEGV